ncbi:hypothetical protein ABT093_22570 [Kitasatospora sp. NPDC002551]|uniref:hypothetical protein n=1 Tax=Kitasatospora sp. NPDC002551 TaxID=3154539 RepID=UPI003320BDB3
MEVGAGAAARRVLREEDELVCRRLYGLLANRAQEAREVTAYLRPWRRDGIGLLGRPKPDAVNAVRRACRWALRDQMPPGYDAVVYRYTFDGSWSDGALFALSALDRQRFQAASAGIASRREFEAALNTALHRAQWIAELCSGLAVERPVLDIPAERNPPRHGLLRHGIVGRALCEEIAEQRAAGEALRHAAAAGHPVVPAIRAWVAATAGVLDRGLTDEDAGQGLRQLTDGLRHCVRRTVPHPPAAAGAYLTLGLEYLEKLEQRMPDHIEASGQGPQPAPVTVHGNVGAINSQVTGSSIVVAETVRGIEVSIGALDRDGRGDLATALQQLTAAVQLERAFAEDLRARLLDHVADVAEAAAEPDRPRALSRARLAMAALTGAAATSSQLAQTLTTWHDVFNRFA